MATKIIKRRTQRLAANPIGYWNHGSKADTSRERFSEAFRELRDIGFTAVKADIPGGMTATEYADWIGSYGLAPSLSLFNSSFDDSVEIVEVLEEAKIFAAGQLALGLDRTMISSVWVPARMERPAVGADFNGARLRLAIENVGRVCEVFKAEGLRPLLHSHVGGVFETEAEVTLLLDTLGKELIGFGPDTGHLRWAGMDPEAMIRRYADRIGGIHIKDCFADYLEPAASEGMSYQDLGESRRLWAEPGSGVVDFEAIVAAMPADYDGDYMIEIDVPSVISLYDSHSMSFAWATKALAGVNIQRKTQ